MTENGATKLVGVTMRWISILLLASVMDCSAQSMSMGITGLLVNTDSGNAGLILAQKTTLSQAAALQSISFYIVRSSGTLRLGLYDATGAGGNPGNKLAETSILTPVNGWNTVAVPPLNLASGNYWLAYEVSTNNSQYLTSYGAGRHHHDRCDADLNGIGFRQRERALSSESSSFPSCHG